MNIGVSFVFYYDNNRSMKSSIPTHPNDDFAERPPLSGAISQNLTQAEAAKLLDIDRSYYSQIEGSKRQPGNALRTRFQLVEKSSTRSSRAWAMCAAIAYGLAQYPDSLLGAGGRGDGVRANPKRLG